MVRSEVAGWNFQWPYKVVEVEDGAEKTVDDGFPGREYVDALRDDRSRGASELARQALSDLMQVAGRHPATQADQLKSDLLAIADALCRARSSMAPVQNLVGEWRRTVLALDADNIELLRRAAIHRAEDLAAASLAAVETIGALASELIPPRSCIVTHSLSSTVIEVFRHLSEHSVRVIVSESRPLYEGHRLAAELAQLGIRTQLVTDAQLGHFAATADIALVGADAILRDGSVVNKAGTLLLALAAREAAVPFWVCAESFKRSALDPGEFPLAEMSGDELGAPGFGGVRVRNVYFDVTPPHLVGRWLNESSIAEEEPSSGKESKPC
ncbi:MAG: hypothetical protein OEM62_04235 [Acidobacteriota bacterium]|nr:hypothetical protein [Acidobacteriota bacterium]